MAVRGQWEGPARDGSALYLDCTHVNILDVMLSHTFKFSHGRKVDNCSGGGGLYIISNKYM